MPLGEVIAAIERAYPENRLDQLAAAVTHAAHWLWVAERLLERFVARARQARLPWAEIGTRLGVSKQAAQQRFAERSAATAQRAAWQTGADMMPEAPLVTGVPCSNGVAAGPARLVRSVDDFAAVRAGDVIVCRTTDPSWTVLFGIAAAVVTETGGMLCHAAIVAREYGIPAVVAAEGAMDTLANHRMVSVDGTRGHVNAVCAPHRPLNARLVQACTDWQLTILPDGSMQENDHEDASHDRRIVAELASLAKELTPLTTRLTERLTRFSDYDTRFATALTSAADDPEMITGTKPQSAHRVWFELHEDLIATLGIDRASSS